MKKIMSVIALVAMLMGTGLTVRAEEAKTDKPAAKTEKTEAAPKKEKKGKGKKKAAKADAAKPADTKSETPPPASK